jgi:single-stranded DNA-binding protein
MFKLKAIGYLGNDPNIYNINGRIVANFNVAYNRTNKPTIWLKCAIWANKSGILPDIVRSLKKGKRVFVKGKPDVYTSTTPNGGIEAVIGLNVKYIEFV